MTEIDLKYVDLLNKIKSIIFIDSQGRKYVYNVNQSSLTPYTNPVTYTKYDEDDYGEDDYSEENEDENDALLRAFLDA